MTRVVYTAAGDIDVTNVQYCFITLTCWSGLTGVAGQPGLLSGLVVRFWSNIVSLESGVARFSWLDGIWADLGFSAINILRV